MHIFTGHFSDSKQFTGILTGVELGVSCAHEGELSSELVIFSTRP